ncbi:universal stress protein [Oerskovia sp. Sa1BUA8]|uniref:Universal stress protein n=1 Tax=Oerskovia douganii TaxID=2762210 RepID=A0A9D5UBF3_9CELL|nr:universal stress protein [Oerskovia douganii]MBE7699891.1 universal stress protein [Oerskovia douganii]
MIRPLLVGVHPGQHPDIVQRAAGFAHALGTTLACVWVDVGPVPDDGSGERRLQAELDQALRATGIDWHLTVAADGDVARRLDETAVSHDAAVVVVGAHRAGADGWRDEALGGSVAGRLSHLQHRPVVVLPVLPAPTAD